MEKTQTLIQKDTYTLMFIAALFTKAKTWKQSKCPSTDEWIKKMWRVYNISQTHTGILLSHEKDGILNVKQNRQIQRILCLVR